MGERKRKLDVFQAGDTTSQQNGGGVINPYTGMPYSQQYYNILAKRKGKSQVTQC